MKDEETLTSQNVRESYEFLAKKVLEDHAKNYSRIILNFHNEIVRQQFKLSYADLANLDLLYYEALKLDGLGFKGRAAVNEAFDAVCHLKEEKPETMMNFWKSLMVCFSELEDVERQLFCTNEASYLATRMNREEEAVALKKDVIALAYRFEQPYLSQHLPTFEELILQFGAIKGKELFAYEKETPKVIHDPVETNPFYVRFIDKVNERLHDYFEKNPKEFSEQKFNMLKRRYLKEEGLLWSPPKQNDE